MNAKQDYARRRKLGWRALEAWRAAGVLAAWTYHGGHVCFGDGCHDCHEGAAVRFRVVPDEHMTWEDLKGDGYDPKANPDIQPSTLERQEKAEIERCDNAGLWGIVSEAWTLAGWEDVDSIWGFIGSDWIDSGYDTDLMSSALQRRALEPV